MIEISTSPKITFQKDSRAEILQLTMKFSVRIKVEKILKGSLNSIPSPSVKIQIMGGNVWLSCKGKALFGIVDNFLKIKSLLTSPSNVSPYYLK